MWPDIIKFNLLSKIVRSWLDRVIWPMAWRQRFVSWLTLVLVAFTPSFAYGQAGMKSTNFELEAINFGTSFSVQRDLNPPIITEGPNVTEIEATKAIVEWKTDKKSNSTVEYGQSASYTDEIGNVSQVTTHKIIIQGLVAETLYHYRIVSIDNSGNKVESEDKTFSTPSETGIESIKVSDIGYDKALISWKTGNFTASELQYGITKAYGSAKATTALSFKTEHVVQLTDLAPGTEYHYRVVATNQKGEIDRSGDQTFSTIAKPSFISVAASPLNPNEMELRWQTNTPTSGLIKYRQAGASDSEERTAGSSERQTTSVLVLKPLIGVTEYQYSITATDEFGTQVDTGQRRFTTPVDKEAPAINDLKVSVARSGDELVMTVNWKTNEPSTGQIVYGPKQRTDEIYEVPGPSGLHVDHTLVAASLRPSTPYGLTAFASDPAGNRGKTDISFVTPKFRKNIFQLIIDTFFNRFGFVANILQR